MGNVQLTSVSEKAPFLNFKYFSQRKSKNLEGLKIFSKGNYLPNYIWE